MNNVLSLQQMPVEDNNKLEGWCVSWQSVVLGGGALAQ